MFRKICLILHPVINPSFLQRIPRVSSILFFKTETEILSETSYVWYHTQAVDDVQGIVYVKYLLYYVIVPH
jgi:hypothetical protein